MRSLARLIAPVFAATAIVIAGSSSALAAASVSSASLDTDWCFQDVSTTYCFDVDGKVQYVDNKAGSSVTINSRTHTTVTEGGAVVGESYSVESFRGFFGADGTVTMKSNIKTRASNGDETCSYHLVLRIVDYEVTVISETSTCGG